MDHVAAERTVQSARAFVILADVARYLEKVQVRVPPFATEARLLRVQVVEWLATEQRLNAVESTGPSPFPPLTADDLYQPFKQGGK